MTDAIAVEACYLCGSPLVEGKSKLMFSDTRTECGTRWEMKRYCFGEGTLECAQVPEPIRRGPLYEAMTNQIPYEGENLDDDNSEACDS